jgi:hypothetical protein
MFEWESELDQLQTTYNNGRGISTVRSILVNLQHNDLESAQQVYVTDGDKLWQYPAVMEFLKAKFGCRLHLQCNCQHWFCKDPIT